MMNYVFFGTPRFAAIILEKLIKSGLGPKAVVCAPDRPVGRKQIITPPPTKVISEKSNIPVLQPEKIDADFLGKLKSISADFYLVAAYAKILPKDLLTIPREGIIGVHPSLLPKYRGASPIQSTILAGEKETGVSLFLLDEKVDHGPIMSFSKLDVDNKNYETLNDELAEIASDLLIKTLPKFTNKEISTMPQNEVLATYTKKFETNDAYVSPEKLDGALNGNLETSREIERVIRALNPEPGVWTIKDGVRTKVLEAKIVDNRLKLVKIQEAGGKIKQLTVDN